MTEIVKSSRSYESPRRREQAAATRRAILAAAQRLFERDGYTTTSVPAIAEEAGVAVKTIYLAFQTKAKLLRALWEERLAGDEAGVPLEERSSFRAVFDEQDPELALRKLAGRARAVKARSGALMEVIRSAAPADSEIATLWNDIQSKLLEVQGRLVEQLHERGALATTDTKGATDVLWVLNHPSVWQLFVRERGWTGEQYEQWLGDILCSELLSERTRDRGSRGGGRIDRR